jgi:hypothetical protein
VSIDYEIRGFFQLETPQDLLTKLRHDHRRLGANPYDSYAAFDFFVTANSLADWVRQGTTRRAETIPRICEQLADGTKHFILTSPHRGVSGAMQIPGATSEQATSGATRAAAPRTLAVPLGPAEAAELGQNAISVLDLAAPVLAYWKARIGV